MPDYPDDNIPAKLSKIAEQQLAAAIREHQRKLDRDFEERVHAEVNRRLDALAHPNEGSIKRTKAMKLLDCGRDLILKLEAEGKLHPFKLTNSDKGHVYYRKSEVLALMRPAPPTPIERQSLRREPL